MWSAQIGQAFKDEAFIVLYWKTKVLVLKAEFT
jgi:hypothetical protein